MKGLIPVTSRAKSAGTILAAVIAAAALGLPSVTGAAAAATAPAASWPAGLAHPVAASCPRGETLIAPTGGWTDALGVIHVRFKAAPSVTALVPPSGLTAARVTNAMVTDIGLRMHAAASSSYRRQLVRRVLNLSRNRRAPEFCWTKPSAAMLKSSLLRAGKAAPAQRATGGSSPKFAVYDSGNWGGTAVTSAQYGVGINGAQGSWHVADGTPDPSGDSAEATWVGIGGGPGNTSPTQGLIQTGTSVRTGSGFQSWYEAIGTSGCTRNTHFCGSMSSVNAVHNSDSVFGEVTWESSSSACFFFNDNSRSTGSYDVCTALNIPYDHTSAEWVNENLIGQMWLYNNPHTVTWTSQYLSAGFSGAGPWTSPFAGAATSVVMGIGVLPSGSPNNCSNPTILSYPVNIANTSTGGTSQILTCYVPGIEAP